MLNEDNDNAVNQAEGNRMTDEEICTTLRQRIFITAEKGGLGHLASCYSCLEILYTLYAKHILRYDKNAPFSKGRDRLVLSKGHAGLALYAVMCQFGLLSWDEFETYLQPGSHIGGEPCMRDLPGVEATTGSLGHGLCMGVGMALAQKMDRTDARTFVIIGDGECEEGTVWEAAMSAAGFHLDNLIVILDCNQIQKMTTIKETIGSDNWWNKWESFGWLVKEVDGHNILEIERVLNEKNTSEKPLIVIAHTVKGKGVSIMENNPLWHFKLPNRKERKVFIKELGLEEDE